MPNPSLSPDQLAVANRILDEIRSNLLSVANGDAAYLWALRRKVAKELTYDERGKTGHRVKLKAAKRAEQNGLCPICRENLPEKYCVLDRIEAVRGYTADNTRLICQSCDYAVQRERGYK